MIKTRIVNVFISSVALLLAACASSPQTSSTNPAAPTSFENFLVIGVAGDYTARAQFERTVVSALRREGASASTFYSVIGGNKPISPDNVRSAVQSGDFDAVLVTRVLDTDTQLKKTKIRTETDVTTIGDRFVNLFRYNYTDYKKPASMDLKMKVTFSSEVYSTATEDIVWSMESTSKGETNLGLLIDDTSDAIVRGVARARLIRK